MIGLSGIKGSNNLQKTGWPSFALCLAILVSFGAVWTRGINGDDLCIGELANSQGYLEGVHTWLTGWNSRLFLALVQLGAFELPGFSDPLNAPWYLMHLSVLIAHTASSILLLRMMVRAGIAIGAAMVAALVFAIHPVVSQPLLWMAASFGYVYGTLFTLISVWTFLCFERTGSVSCFALSLLFALLAVTGIEQFIVVLWGLVFLHVVASRQLQLRWRIWMPVLVMILLSGVFILIHFVLFSGSSERIGSVAGKAAEVGLAKIPWTILWNLSLIPDVSPYAERLYKGAGVLFSGSGVALFVVAIAFFAASQTVSFRLINGGGTGAWSRRYAQLALAGLAILIAAIIPFYFVGYGDIPTRAIYIALPGVSLIGAAALDFIGRSPAFHKVLPIVLAPAAFVYVGLSSTINVGSQVYYAENWRIHRDIIRELQLHAEEIKGAGAVQVEGLPSPPFGAPILMDAGWDFSCLARWVVGAEGVEAWTNLTPQEANQIKANHPYQIRWSPHD